ncbi:FKBP-type peptidyl-prolyl cis-trans isomerase [Pseudarcicella hirudinis]|uniref:Peptidyl-prolyl cis-trans isomerase n=1 Tax=Pseudarcicella hirudinis TaxID=1079859 RepID=A0A1I5UH51_9BACT|nr:FKBP-type peptidyl-prolyl cis-trans isomerase [Pseudarcicella hirudinis]SFP93946.1 FKBP-type peptidyl-prolyl cis-trans isomerase [Pseudarcicella hirudinis]
MKKSNIIKALCFLSLCVGLGACLSNVELEDDVRKKEMDAQIVAYLAKNNITTATKLGNGSYYFKSLSLNTARQPKQYDSIIVNYTLSDLSGKVLETTSTPFIYRYGFSSPIFNQLISLMKEGEKASVVLPGTAQAFDNLPAYAPLRCDIQSFRIRNEDDLINDFIAGRKLTVTDTSNNGLRYIRVEPGFGDVLASGKVAKVKYVGRFLNGSAFDGNYSTTDSLSVTIGATGSLVTGFQKGVEKMKIGEKAYLVFPSSLGYGTTGSSSIPGNTPLWFEVKLVGSN